MAKAGNADNKRESAMKAPRRDFLKAAAGAAALPLVAAAAGAAPSPAISWDSRLMGAGKFIEVDGIRTRYFEAGAGEAMVLIHGGQWPATSSAESFSSIFDHLAARYHVYAFDKLGMGFTDNPRADADYSMEAVIRHAHGFIKAVGIKRAIVAGHSRGALPAAGIAVDDPDLVSHLVIFDTNALASGDIKMAARTDVKPMKQVPTRESIRKADLASPLSVRKDWITDTYVDGQYRIASLPKLAEADRKFRELKVKWIKDNPEKMKADPRLGNNVGAVVWWLVDAKNTTMQMIRAGRLKAPTVLIWGWNDAFAPYALGIDTMTTISKVVPRTEMHIINQASHFVFAEHPQEVSRLIANFVSPA
jgi:2-hydroxy-6-oxo-6-(2'-carboxyphenyl)-hexa-2,4-dienoate hydrolase